MFISKMSKKDGKLKKYEVKINVSNADFEVGTIC